MAVCTKPVRYCDSALGADRALQVLEEITRAIAARRPPALAVVKAVLR